MDLLPIPHPLYQIPLEVSSAITTGIDIAIADVPWYRKLAAIPITIYGLGGAFQMVPQIGSVLLGTAIDLSAYAAISYLLGEENPDDPIVRMIDVFFRNDGDNPCK